MDQLYVFELANHIDLCCQYFDLVEKQSLCLGLASVPLHSSLLSTNACSEYCSLTLHCSFYLSLPTVFCFANVGSLPVRLLFLDKSLKGSDDFPFLTSMLPSAELLRRLVLLSFASEIGGREPLTLPRILLFIWSMMFTTDAEA